jgi:hypothetical protein
MRRAATDQIQFFAINLKTAKTLKVAPPTLLAWADGVIEWG